MTLLILLPVTKIARKTTLCALLAWNYIFKPSRRVPWNLFLFVRMNTFVQGVKLALAQSHLRPFLRLGDQNLDYQSPRWRVQHKPYLFVCQFFLSSPTQFCLKSWSVRCFNALEVVYHIFSAFTIETTMFTC